MTCSCGNSLIETTDSDDRERIFYCGECGKQGPPRVFRVQDPEVEPSSLIQRIRIYASDFMYRVADRIAI